MSNPIPGRGKSIASFAGNNKVAFTNLKPAHPIAPFNPTSQVSINHLVFLSPYPS